MRERCASLFAGEVHVFAHCFWPVPAPANEMSVPASAPANGVSVPEIAIKAVVPTSVNYLHLCLTELCTGLEAASTRMITKNSTFKRS